MRIGIDARFLTHPQPGGFKTYTESLIMALGQIDSGNDYILYVDRQPSENTRLPNLANFDVKAIPGTLSLIGMPWREQVGLSRQVSRDQLDLLHSLCLTAPIRVTCPLVLTVHDMIWYDMKKFAQKRPWSAHRKIMEIYVRFVTERAARNAAAIISPSNSAKDHIVQHLGISDERIFVIYEAANSIYQKVDDAMQVKGVREKYGLRSEYILTMGSADPRKNTATLVRAYSFLPVTLQRRYGLAIVMTHPFLAKKVTEQVEKLGMRDRVDFLQGVTNEDLALIYNAASLFVFPSRYEGFGLPLLEAMACGTPVIAGNNSSIPEVVGDAAILVDADDAEAMAKQIKQLLNDPAQQNSLTDRGLEQASRFSWMNCGQQTLEIYEKVNSVR